MSRQTARRKLHVKPETPYPIITAPVYLGGNTPAMPNTPPCSTAVVMPTRQKASHLAQRTVNYDDPEVYEVSIRLAEVLRREWQHAADHEREDKGSADAHDG